jgi:hypothetical protein
MWKYRWRLTGSQKEKYESCGSGTPRGMAQQFHLPRRIIFMPLNRPECCSRVINKYRIRQNVKMTHKIKYLSSGAHVSNNRISPYISAVAKCVLPLRELCISHSEWRHLLRTVSWRTRSYERKWITHFHDTWIMAVCQECCYLPRGVTTRMCD